MAATQYSYTMDIIAHRGSSAAAPENTLAAIDLAVRSGVLGAEFDVQFTRDGEVVLVHDETLERVAANTFNLPEEEYQRIITTPVSDLSYGEIRMIDVGAWKGEAFKGTRVPTLQEALLALRGKAAMIDIKAGTEIIPHIAQILEEFPTEVIFVSFSINLINEVKMLMPQYPCYYVRLSLNFLLEQALERAAPLEGLSLEAGPLITEELVAAVHAGGKKLMAWVAPHPDKLDTPETRALYERMGVDYFITNQPDTP